jgi:hypothetical protein
MNCSFRATLERKVSRRASEVKSMTHDELDEVVVESLIIGYGGVLNCLEQMLNEAIVEYFCERQSALAMGIERILTEIVDIQLLDPTDLIQQPNTHESQPRLDRNSKCRSISIVVNRPLDVIHEQRNEALPSLMPC